MFPIFGGLFGGLFGASFLSGNFRLPEFRLDRNYDWSRGIRNAGNNANSSRVTQSDMVKVPSVANRKYTSAEINKMNFSKDILPVIDVIESYKKCTYPDSQGVATVGRGITLFRTGSMRGKRPEFRIVNGKKVGVCYTDDFLYQEELAMSAEKLATARAVLIRENHYRFSQKVFDAIYYICINGFRVPRQEDFGRKVRSDVDMANWLLTPAGIGPFFGDNERLKSLRGIIRARIILANYIMGLPLNTYVNEYYKSAPKDRFKVRELYRAGKLALPVYRKLT